MKGELRNFASVCFTIMGSLLYCHSVAKFMPKGKYRLFAILPIICLFLYLPLSISSFYFRGTTSFLIVWLANFKLLLFAFGRGPLSSNTPMQFSKFISISILPIKIQHHPSPLNLTSKEPQLGVHQTHKRGPSSFIVKVVLMALIFKVYDYREHLHQNSIWTLYLCHIYIALEIMLATSATVARVVARVELEPHFNKPYFSTSLQDFWGRRWNLVVSSILRSSAYEPVEPILARLISRKWAPLIAMLVTFLVSGVMHELIFYHIGRLRPTGEVTCFFLIHGVCLMLEIIVKKMFKDKYELHPLVSGPLTIVFVVVTAFRLFLPPLLRAKPDVGICKESNALLEFIKRGQLVSPDDMSCSFS